MKGSSLLHLSKHFREADDIRLRLLRLLYDNFSGAAVVIWFNASLLVYILWPVADHTQLLFWYAFISGITLIRVVDTSLFFRQKSPTYSQWYKRLFLGVLFSAMAWGAIPLIFFASVAPIYQMFIIILTVGMSAGALSTLAADLRLSFIYLFALLVPLAYRLLEADSPIYFASFILVFAFIIVVIRTAREFHLSLVESYRNLELYHHAKARLSKSEQRLHMMFEQAPIGIFYYDNDLVIVDANNALCAFLHAERDQLVGLHLRELPDQRPLRSAYHDDNYTRYGVYEGPYHTKLRGLDLWIKVEFIPIVDDRGGMIGGMAMFTDKTQEHNAMKQAEFLALHDPLTRMPNRELLKERIRQLLKEDRRLARYSALLFLDLDRFKHINDSAGHLVGDQLLVETARRLETLLRESDTLSRLGGDEFVILLPVIASDEDGTVRHAFQVAEKIHEALRQPYRIEGHQLYTSCSIGITTLESFPDDIDEVLRRADTAMYQAKEEGRDRTRFYDPEMDQKARDYLRTQQRLRHAIDTGGFTLCYQPIVRIATDTIIAAEALLRWHDEIGNPIPPAHFIPVAEESGMIKAIGEWVIDETCRQIRTWEAEGIFNLEYISVNISPRQLIESDFADVIVESVRRHGIVPEQLRLEITETALIENFDKTKKLIEALNAEGVKFIIDDFGTGYSSLSYLKQFSFSALKIDQSFIRDILQDPKDAALVRAIIDIARQFGYQVIAEGVEEEAQREMLRENDAAVAYQGYLCSEAKAASAFAEYLHKKGC